MMAACQEPDAVDDAVGGDGFDGEVAGVHGPSYHAGGAAGAQGTADGAVGGDAPFGDLAGYFVDEFEEVVVLFAGGADRREFFAGGGAGGGFGPAFCGGLSFLFRHVADLFVVLIISTGVVLVR